MIKILKKPIGSVWFRFYKPEIKKTKPNQTQTEQNQKKKPELNRKKPSQAEKTDPDQKIRTKPV